MIARCARCQGTFTTDRFGLQTCPHCGSELLLSDPNAPQRPPVQPPAAGPGEPPAPPSGFPPAAPPPPPAGALPPASPPSGGWGAPPAGGAGWGPPPGGAPPPPGGAPPPPGAWGPPPGGFGPPPGAGAPFELPSPFAERAQRGFLAAFFETWKLVATQPEQFFRRVRIDQTGTAILFGVIAATVGSVVAGLYRWLGAQQALVAMESLRGRFTEEQSRVLTAFFTGTGTLAQIVIAPIVSLIAMYVGAAILHLLLMLFRGAKRPFDATLTVVAYAQGLNLLLAVPLCGGLLAGVWALVVLIIGLGEAQRCGSGKAAAAVLAPAVLLCACCCLGAGLSVPALLKHLEGATPPGTQTTTL